MDLVLHLEARFTDLIPIGLVPEGVRVDAHFAGSITAGPFTGGTVRGIDYLPDGIHFPPSELLVQPDFVWPDLAVPLHGVALCQTGIADIAWLNRTALLFQGASNPGARTLGITASAFIPIPERRAVVAGIERGSTSEVAPQM